MTAAGVSAWAVDPLDGPQVELLNVPSFHAVTTPTEAEAMADRWAAMGPWIDTYVDGIAESLARGVVSPVSPVRRVVDQLDDLLGRPDDDWPLLEPLAVDHPDWPTADRDRFDARLRAAIRDGIRPAFTRYRAFLVDTLLPQARRDDDPGLSAVPGGAEAYAALV